MKLNYYSCSHSVIECLFSIYKDIFKRTEEKSFGLPEILGFVFGQDPTHAVIVMEVLGYIEVLVYTIIMMIQTLLWRYLLRPQEVLEL